jgi:hypothetical protein
MIVSELEVTLGLAAENQQLKELLARALPFVIACDWPSHDTVHGDKFYTNRRDVLKQIQAALQQDLESKLPTAKSAIL